MSDQLTVRERLDRQDAVERINTEQPETHSLTPTVVYKPIHQERAQYKRVIEHSRRDQVTTRCRSCLRKMPTGKPGRECSGCRNREWENDSLMKWTSETPPPFGKLYDADGVEIDRDVQECDRITGLVVWLTRDTDGQPIIDLDKGQHVTESAYYKAPLKFVPRGSSPS